MVMRIPKPAKGYNTPFCFACFLAQFSHQRFLDGRISWEEHHKFSELAYKVFPPRKAK